VTPAVRPFAQSDLPAVARFCDRARAIDPAVEPFARSLAALASGQRARLDLWRVAPEGGDELCGIAFAALREGGSASALPWLDIYAAVSPPRRRGGIGSALCGAILAEQAVLRARVHEESRDGRAFLRSLGFEDRSVLLSMLWSARPLDAPAARSVRLRKASKADSAMLEALSREAWGGKPEAFTSRPEEVSRFFAEGQLALVAESGRRPVGYLTGALLGRALAIEEVAVLPRFRRSGIGRALLVEAIRDASHAMLTVAESNHAARALYHSLGFAASARRIVCERPAAPRRAVRR
jgi:ribosomal protein S18 acetylase RimI-like enzyme